MKKKIMLSLAAVMVFGLAIVAVAYTYAGNSASSVAVSCCCHGDSCPMKAKSADGKEAASCCDNCENCCHGDAASCPMMKKDADGNPVKMDAAHGTHPKHEMKADGSGCCCACCQKTMDSEKIAAPAV